MSLIIVWDCEDCDLTLSPPIRFLAAAAAARGAKWVSTENRTNGGQRMRKEGGADRGAGGRMDADGGSKEQEEEEEGDKQKEKRRANCRLGHWREREDGRTGRRRQMAWHGGICLLGQDQVNT